MKPHVPQLFSSTSSSSSRPIVYQSPRVPPRRSPPELTKPSYLPILCPTELTSPKDESFPTTESPSEGFSTPDSSSTNTICSLNLSIEPTDIKNPHHHHQSTTSEPLSSNSASPSGSKLSSPLPSPRSPSKIPTPLPRKSLPNSPVNSSSSTHSSPSCSSNSSSAKFPPLPPQSPVKLPRSSLTRVPVSEIPVPVRASPPTSCPGSPPSPTTRSTTKPIPSPDTPRRLQATSLLEVMVSTGYEATSAATATSPGDIEVRADEQLITKS